MSKHTYAEYKPGYEQLLKSYKVKPEWAKIIDDKALRILKNKDKYVSVSRRTNVPWPFIAVIHNLESGGSFSTHLHNGDPLTARTKRVPKGHPKTGKPPFSWEDSAVDALAIKNLQVETDWSDPKVAYELERYNGFGYRGVKVNSPYLWSGTDKYRVGKYVSDGKYDPSHVSSQIGAIPLYKRIVELEKETEKEEARKADQVLKENSRSYKALNEADNVLKLSAGAVAGLSFTEYMGIIQNFMLSWKGALLMGGLFAFSWLILSYVKSRKKQEYKEGRYQPSGTVDAPTFTE